MGTESLNLPYSLHQFGGPFTKSNHLLGRASEQSPTTIKQDLAKVRMRARHLFTSDSTVFEPTDLAVSKTKQAASDFFSYASNQLVGSSTRFPLAGLNKCLGFAVVPGTKLVEIALSMDRAPDKDRDTRHNLYTLIQDINSAQKTWTFELVNIPTKEEFVLVRSLDIQTPQTADSTTVEPRSRCVEVALMVALCKAGRFKHFRPQDVAMMAFGGTLWKEQDPVLSHPMPGFHGETDCKRNSKYISEVVPVRLANGSEGFIDVWAPCEEHCKKYLKHMQSILASGGPATNLTDPRADYSFAKDLCKGLLTK